MYNNNTNNVQSIRNKLEKQLGNDSKKCDRFVLKRSATSLGSIETNLLNLNLSPPKPIVNPPPKFYRAKTSSELLKSDVKNNNIINYQPILSRQLSDPIKKGNIKRTPAFRCEKLSDNSSEDHVILSNLSSKTNLSNKIRMFEQCRKPSDLSPKISSSPTKFKSNKLLRDELEFIVKRREELSSSSSRSSSSSPVSVPIKVIPEYSQVIKNRKKKLSSFITPQTNDDNLTDTLKKALKSPLPDGPPPKKPPRTFAHSSTSPNISNQKKSIVIDTGQKMKTSKTDPRLMLDKLENALLQNKIKSPRSRRKIMDVENIKKDVMKPSRSVQLFSSDTTQQQSSPQKSIFFNDCFPICTNNNGPEYATPLRSKSEFFVDKNILLDNNRLCKPTTTTVEQHIYAEPFQFKKTTDVPDNFNNNNRIKRSDLQKSCNNDLNLSCGGGRDDRTKLDKKLENNKSSPDLHYLSTPVSAAPLPSTTTLLSSSPVYSSPTKNKNNNNNNNNNNCNNNRKSFGQQNRTTSFEKLLIHKDLHHQHHHHQDKNIFDNTIGQQFPKSISPICQNSSSTDSDFESSASTPPSCDDEQIKNYLNNKNNTSADLKTTSPLDYSINNKLYYALTNKMSQNVNNNHNNNNDNNNLLNNETALSTPVGRVRALVQKLENVDIIDKNDNMKKVISPSKFNQTSTSDKVVEKNEFLEKNLQKNQYFIEKLSQQLLSLDSENDMSFENKEIVNKQKKINHEMDVRHQEASRKLSMKHKMYVKRVSSRVDKYAKVTSQNDCSPHLFDCCLLVGLNMSTKTAYIKNKYPEEVKIPHGIESLCFPDANHWDWNLNSKEYGGTYTLIITNENGDRRFGFCRRVLPEGELVYLPLVYCVLSPFRAVDFFNKVLKEIETRHGLPDFILNTFLQELYNTPFPKPGSKVRVKYLKSEIEIEIIPPPTSSDNEISSSKNISPKSDSNDLIDGCNRIDMNLENNRDKQNVICQNKKNIQRSYSSPLLNGSGEDSSKTTCEIKEYEMEFSRPFDTRTSEEGLAVLLDTLNVTIVLQIFSSLLLERKIVFLCLTISKLSTCMEALQTMLYPFAWQHTFISVLPSNLVDVLNAPTPYLIGALTTACENFTDIEDGIVIDLDKGTVLRNVGDENAIIPSRIQNFLKLALNSDEIKSTSNRNTRNLLISEAFIGAFLHLCANYKEFFIIPQSKSSGREQDVIKFDKEHFIKANTSKSIQLFLEWFTETSMFNAFIDSEIKSIQNHQNRWNKCENNDHFQQRCDAFMLKKHKKKTTFGEKLKNWTHF